MIRHTLLIYTTLFASTLVHGSLTQWFSLHENIECEGESRNFTDTILNLPDLGDELLNRTRSWRTQGFWNLTFTDGTHFWSVNRYQYVYCDYYNDGGIVSVQSAKKIHPYDFDESALLVAESWDAWGSGHTVDPDNDLETYNPPITVGGWIFTGNDSFVFHDGKGNSVCVEPDDGTKERGYGIQWGDEIPFPVEAIVRANDCENFRMLPVEGNVPLRNSKTGKVVMAE